MTPPGESAIKSGGEILSEFLDALEPGESLDMQTITSIRELHEAGKLSRTRLLQTLEEVRSTAQQIITKPSEQDGR
jgi:hypothetical protein